MSYAIRQVMRIPSFLQRLVHGKAEPSGLVRLRAVLLVANHQVALLAQEGSPEVLQIQRMLDRTNLLARQILSPDLAQEALALSGRLERVLRQ